MLRHVPLAEKVLVFLLVIVIAIFSTRVYQAFRDEHAVLAAAEGGVYTEGLVGQLTTLNPLLARSSADRDVSRLIFAGLTKYNSVTGEIEPDLATYDISPDRKVYTFRLKEGLMWHDGEPLTVDDVIYTYKVVLQNQYFPNKFLQDAFKDIDIQRQTDRELTFTLKTPYSFFLSNVTLGILPKHILNLVPIENLHKSDFNLHPIGAGPFQFSSFDPGARESRVVLKRFDDYHGGKAYVDSVVFRIVPTEEDLVSQMNSLTAVKNVPEEVDLTNHERFGVIEYTLPQYVAVFLNTQSPILSVSKARFGLLLATDKQEMIDRLGGKKQIVDTPILEAKEGLDIEYNEERARGAFFDTAWKLYSKEDTDSTDEHEDKDVDVNEDGDVTEHTEDTLGENDAVSEEPAYKARIVARSDVSIRLQVDGQLRDAFSLKNEEKKDFAFDEMFTFVHVSNAGGIAFFIDGREAKLLGLPDEEVKDFVVKGDALDDVLKEDQVEILDGFTDWGLDDEGDHVEDDHADEVPIEELRMQLAGPDEDKELYKLNVDPDAIRYDQDGNALRLRLITSSVPAEYLDAALILQEQWLQAGVDLLVEVYEPDVLQQKILERDYDVLLFGQNLGYNLDAFPFWHSSQAESGLNLAKYKSLETDNLLVDIRSTVREDTKVKKLNQLKQQVAKDTPAIFLYTPVYNYAIDHKVMGVDLPYIALEGDRFNTLHSWYLREKRVLKEGVGLRDFFTWVLNNL